MYPSIKLSIFPLFQLIFHVFPICYYPDGTTTPSDVPCYNNNEASFCCGWGFACLSNKVCHVTPETPNPNTTSAYVRGSCTDQSWRSGNCPNFCVNPQYDDVGGGEGMALCPGTDNVFYCVDDTTVDCNNLTNIAFESTGIPYALTTIGFGSSSASSASSTTSLATTSTSQTAGTSHTTPTSTSTSTNTPAPAPTPVGAIAGATVGGVIGVAALALLAFWLYRKNQHRYSPARQEHERNGAPTSVPSPYLPSNTMPKYQQPFTHELYTPPSELDGQQNSSELSALSPAVAGRRHLQIETSSNSADRS